MKKLLVLFMVLGLASAANAGLIFTVNGEAQPDEITLDPDGILYPASVELDLEVEAGQNSDAYVLGYYLVDPVTGQPCQTAAFDWSGAVFPSFDLAGVTVGGGSPSSNYLQVSGANIFSPTVVGWAELMTDLYVDCLAPGDQDLLIIMEGATVIDGVDIDGTGNEHVYTTEVYDDVIHKLVIHQIPEPMTMALLGLGGLALIRRRKA